MLNTFKGAAVCRERASTSQGRLKTQKPEQ